MRCRECATHHFLTVAKVDPERIAWAMSTALMVAMLGAVALRGMGVLAMAAGPLYGFMVAETIVRIAGKSARFQGFEYAGPAVILGGVAIAYAKPFSQMGSQLLPLPAAFAQFAGPIIGLSVGLAVSACYKRLRGTRA